MGVKEKLRSIRARELSAVDNISTFLNKIKKEDRRINSFIQLNPDALKEAKLVDEKIKARKAGRLAGLAIAVKSNINVKGLLTTCASQTLANYNASYNATVIERIKAEDGIIIGMTNMDEFACGGSGETSSFGPTQNPAARGRIPGGSSSGSAAAIAAGFCDLALGSDTGGSIRNPASHCGILGLKPSYGLVSRYGLIDLAMSLDQIGPFAAANDVYGTALLLSVIAGHDEKDTTTADSKISKLLNYHTIIDKLPKKLTIGLSDDFAALCRDKKIYKAVEDAALRLSREYGWPIRKVSLKHVDLAVQTYYPLCYVEFFSATRRYDGRKYGKRIEEVCGPEVLRRILGGSEISKAEYYGKYYRRALLAAQLISQDLAAAFKKVDVILSPTVPALPHKIGSKISTEEMYSYDSLTNSVNLAGICALSIPCGYVNKIPVGLQIMAPAFAEATALQVARAWVAC